MDEASPKQWRLHAEPGSEDWLALCRAVDIPRPALSVIWNRGIRTPAEAARYLNPALDDLEDPFALTDMKTAVVRLRSALARQETILTYGDYDVDGLTALALWTRVLRRLGGRVVTTLPNRLEDGYGLSVRAVETARSLGASLLVASDCGTTAHRAVERAAQLGIDVVITDHHTPGDHLPPALALINPRREGDASPFADLAAVGVAYKALQALVSETGGPEEKHFLEDQLDLVALGTIADVVALRGENRILVQAGLEILRRRPRAAMRALLDRTGLDPWSLDASHLAYFLVPRLNASGRLGVPQRALDLLLSDDEEEARRLAEVVEEDNKERRRLNERVLAEALARIEAGGEDTDGAIILASADWHPGVLGIAASRLAERFSRPALLISLRGETARGSARTPPGIDLLQWIQGAGSLLQAFGGHPQAVGLSLDPERFAAIRDRLRSEAENLPRSLETGSIEVDVRLDPCSCDLPLVRWLERMAPFGTGNPEPLFVGRTRCREVRVQQGRHLRMRAGTGRRTVDCIGFGMARRAADLFGGAELEMVYHPTVNRHRGDDRVQLKMREFRLGEFDHTG